MKIQKVDRYLVQGKLYDTEKKAIDAVESEVHQFVKKLCTHADLSYYSTIKITDYLINNKEILVTLLGCLQQGVVED
jgi:hypothetical protein